MATQCFNRWFHLGVWERLLALAQEHGGGAKLGMTFLDGSTIRPPVRGGCGPKAGSSAERDARAAVGRSRGGFGAKAVALADKGTSSDAVGDTTPENQSLDTASMTRRA